jgi:hypothetical protein
VHGFSNQKSLFLVLTFKPLMNEVALMELRAAELSGQARTYDVRIANPGVILFSNGD